MSEGSEWYQIGHKRVTLAYQSFEINLSPIPVQYFDRDFFASSYRKAALGAYLLQRSAILFLSEI